MLVMVGWVSRKSTTVAAIDELFVEQKRISGRGRLSTAARTALTAIYDTTQEWPALSP